MYQTERFLADNADKIPADAKANVDGPLEELKKAIEANDIRGHQASGRQGCPGQPGARRGDVPVAGTARAAAGGGDDARRLRTTSSTRRSWTRATRARARRA